MIKIKKGLDLPVTGAPQQKIHEGPKIRTVAVVGNDYVGMKPTMEVKEGDRVKKGQVLFTDKKTPGVKYTAPASGIVAGINRGSKRVLLSIVIEVDGDEAEVFEKYSSFDIASISRDKVVGNLVNSGLWTALRTRPFSKVPTPESQPSSIFVTAIDSNPLAANPEIIISEHRDDFALGLDILAKLTEGSVFVCKAPGADIPTGNDATISIKEFSGPHPAGLVGTHIHFLDAVSDKKYVWHIGYQDVIAVGKLFVTGELYVDTVLSLAGPRVLEPKLIRSRIGASTLELVAGQTETKGQENRVISGSLLSGRTARGHLTYVGRYHQQVSVIQEDRHRYLLGYLTPGGNKHSVTNVFLSKFNPKKLFPFTTTSNGSPRAMVPVGSYERVMPLDILPTHLLRSLVIGDLETAQALGCLELDEEDLALCTYVCPGKYEYGPILRDNLTRIEKEG